MQLKAIIFDYGGVLCTPPPEGQVRELAAACRLEYEQFLEGYWSLRASYDRGDIDVGQYWTGIGRPFGRTYTGDEIARFSRADVMFWVHIDPPMLDWAARVRAAGIPTGLLSNLPRDLGEYFRRETDLLENFDRHTFSYELNVAKPEPGIYRFAVDALGVEPGEALFIDDRAENVEGAKRFGMPALQFVSRRQLALDLDRLETLNGCRLPFGTPPVLLE